MKALEILKQQRNQKEKELSKIVTHGIHTQDLLDEIAEYDKTISEIENCEDEYKINLSLELLSEVMVDHITNVKIEGPCVTFGGDITEYVMLDWWETMKLSDFAIKCKEWAKDSKGFVITSTDLEEIFNTCELLLMKDDI
jgi:hypothetical protein